jgi:hypothetical protein
MYGVWNKRKVNIGLLSLVSNSNLLCTTNSPPNSSVLPNVLVSDRPAQLFSRLLTLLFSYSSPRYAMFLQAINHRFLKEQQIIAGAVNFFHSVLVPHCA